MTRKILLLCVVLSVCAAGWAQSFHYKKLEDLHFDWAGQSLEFVVERQVSFGEGEPETAPARLRVWKDGQRIAEFDLQWGITQYKGEYAHEATFPENLAQSRYLLFVNIVSSKPPVLLAFGAAVGDALGPVYAYGLDTSGNPHQWLARDHFGFERLSDIGRTGEEKIVTHACEPQSADGEFVPYNPFVIWRIGENKAEIDKPLTRSYNEQVYVWSGAECRQDLMVVKDPNGKWQFKKAPEAVREPGEEVHDVNSTPH
jgi:hypothetical protein